MGVYLNIIPYFGILVFFPKNETGIMEEPMNKKIHTMAVFIEFLAGYGLALFFHLVLHNPEAAYIIFGVGILLSLATYLLREDIKQTRRRLLDQYDYANEITFAIARMTDPECQANPCVAGVSW